MQLKVPHDDLDLTPTRLQNGSAPSSTWDRKVASPEASTTEMRRPSVDQQSVVTSGSSSAPSMAKLKTNIVEERSTWSPSDGTPESNSSRSTVHEFGALSSRRRSSALTEDDAEFSSTVCAQISEYGEPEAMDDSSGGLDEHKSQRDASPAERLSQSNSDLSVTQDRDHRLRRSLRSSSLTSDGSEASSWIAEVIDRGGALGDRVMKNLKAANGFLGTDGHLHRRDVSNQSGAVRRSRTASPRSPILEETRSQTSMSFTEVSSLDRAKGNEEHRSYSAMDIENIPPSSPTYKPLFGDVGLSPSLYRRRQLNRKSSIGFRSADELNDDKSADFDNSTQRQAYITSHWSASNLTNGEAPLGTSIQKSINFLLNRNNMHSNNNTPLTPHNSQLRRTTGEPGNTAVIRIGEDGPGGCSSRSSNDVGGPFTSTVELGGTESATTTNRSRNPVRNTTTSARLSGAKGGIFIAPKDVVIIDKPSASTDDVTCTLQSPKSRELMDLVDSTPSLCHRLSRSEDCLGWASDQDRLPKKSILKRRLMEDSCCPDDKTNTWESSSLASSSLRDTLVDSEDEPKRGHSSDTGERRVSWMEGSRLKRTPSKDLEYRNRRENSKYFFGEEDKAGSKPAITSPEFRLGRSRLDRIEETSSPTHRSRSVPNRTSSRSSVRATTSEDSADESPPLSVLRHLPRHYTHTARTPRSTSNSPARKTIRMGTSPVRSRSVGKTSPISSAVSSLSALPATQKVSSSTFIYPEGYRRRESKSPPVRRESRSPVRTTSKDILSTSSQQRYYRKPSESPIRRDSTRPGSRSPLSIRNRPASPSPTRPTVRSEKVLSLSTPSRGSSVPFRRGRNPSDENIVVNHISRTDERSKSPHLTRQDAVEEKEGLTRKVSLDALRYPTPVPPLDGSETESRTSSSLLSFPKPSITSSKTFQVSSSSPTRQLLSKLSESPLGPTTFTSFSDLRPSSPTPRRRMSDEWTAWKRSPTPETMQMRSLKSDDGFSTDSFSEMDEQGHVVHRRRKRSSKRRRTSAQSTKASRLRAMRSTSRSPTPPTLSGSSTINARLDLRNMTLSVLSEEDGTTSKGSARMRRRTPVQRESRPKSWVESLRESTPPRATTPHQPHSERHAVTPPRTTPSQSRNIRRPASGGSWRLTDEFTFLSTKDNSDTNSIGRTRESCAIHHPITTHEITHETPYHVEEPHSDTDASLSRRKPSHSGALVKSAIDRQRETRASNSGTQMTTTISTTPAGHVKITTQGTQNRSVAEREVVNAGPIRGVREITGSRDRKVVLEQTEGGGRSRIVKQITSSRSVT
ncbi:unnamed protein product [Cyprideis torosa]|uniref:Uncharacterized protein n=1 Tax=Cyprideis torosa TaxID=163714 RepID=A0A7R8W7M6_9CRUS|nr:unnamed protein product [Cyprideis torosa]CAG0887718.1 unnamed protein product [Cyprideis torosa]